MHGIQCGETLTELQQVMHQWTFFWSAAIETETPITGIINMTS